MYGTHFCAQCSKNRGSMQSFKYYLSKLSYEHVREFSLSLLCICSQGFPEKRRKRIFFNQLTNEGEETRNLGIYFSKNRIGMTSDSGWEEEEGCPQKPLVPSALQAKNKEIPG